MSGTYSVERLVHYRCEACSQWWTIGDGPTDQYLYCPKCELGQFFTEAPCSTLIEPSGGVKDGSCDQGGTLEGSNATGVTKTITEKVRRSGTKDNVAWDQH